KPSKNQDEFAHYLLMSDIRTFYLECMAVEYQLNLPGLGGATPGELADHLHRLHPKELDQRFIDLQKHAFYLSELNLENELRNARLKSLLAKLEKTTD